MVGSLECLTFLSFLGQLHHNLLTQELLQCHNEVQWVISWFFIAVHELVTD